MRFYSIFGAVLRKFIANVVVLRFYNTKRFNFNTVFRNFMGNFNAVFLCFSVRCLYVFLCGFAVFVPPLRPPFTTSPGSLSPSFCQGEWVSVHRLSNLYGHLIG